MPDHTSFERGENANVTGGDAAGESAHAASGAPRHAGTQATRSAGEVSRGFALPRKGKRLSWEDLDLFAEELAGIARSGLPLVPALRNLANDVHRPELRATLERMHARLEGGASIDEAVAAVGERLPPVFTALMRAGEASGNLAGVLQLLSGYTAHMRELKHRLQLAMAYPAMLIVASAAVILFMLVVVVPDYAIALEGLRGRFGESGMPWPTRTLIGLSAFLRENGLVLVASLAAAAALGRAGVLLLRRSGPGRTWWDALGLAVPILGRVRYLAAVSRFGRTLSALLRSQVGAVDSLGLAANASGNAMLERAVRHAAKCVNEGESIAEGLIRTRFFARDFCWLVSTCEERGEPALGLDHAAAKYERELEMRERMLAGMMNPVVVVLVGFLVLGIMSSLYWPVIEMFRGGYLGRM